MKNIFKCVFPLLAILLIIGCSDDDKKTEPNIVGTWHLTGMHDYVTETFTPVEACYHETATFNSNGTGSDNVIDCENMQGNYPFLWEKDEAPNAYTFTIDGDILIPREVHFESNNKMTISFGDDSAKIYERMLAE
jgi:hypothetical protein